MKGTNITQYPKKVPADVVTKNTVKEANTFAFQIVIVDFREPIRHTHIGHLPPPFAFILANRADRGQKSHLAIIVY